MRRGASLLVVAVLVSAGCVREGLLYPGDEAEATPPGYGRVVFGVEDGLSLYTVDLCMTGGGCQTVGPFMQIQPAYVLQLPAGEHCMTAISAQDTGDVAGGGSALGYEWHPERACFSVVEGQLGNLGMFTLVDNGGERGLDVVPLPGVDGIARQHYPAL